MMIFWNSASVAEVSMALAPHKLSLATETPDSMSTSYGYKEAHGKVVALLYDWFVINLAFRRCRSATPTRENHNLTRRPFPLNGPAQSLID